MENKFSISLENSARKRKQLVYFDHQKLHHYVNSTQDTSKLVKNSSLCLEMWSNAIFRVLYITQQLTFIAVLATVSTLT